MKLDSFAKDRLVMGPVVQGRVFQVRFGVVVQVRGGVLVQVDGGLLCVCGEWVVQVVHKVRFSLSSYM